MSPAPRIDRTALEGAVIARLRTGGPASLEELVRVVGVSDFTLRPLVRRLMADRRLGRSLAGRWTRYFVGDPPPPRLGRQRAAPRPPKPTPPPAPPRAPNVVPVVDPHDELARDILRVLGHGCSYDPREIRRNLKGACASATPDAILAAGEDLARRGLVERIPLLGTTRFRKRAKPKETL